MRLTFRSLLLLALLHSTAVLSAQVFYAQITPLPPGSSLPDDDSTSISSSDQAAAHAASLIAKAEDAILASENDKAIRLLNQALAIAPTTSPEAARAWYDRGYIEQQQQQTAAAEADFRKAIAANPRQFESRAALGRLLAQQQQWKQARQELEMAITLQPASGDRVRLLADTERTLARVDAELHDPAAASDALLAALKQTPEQPDDTLLAAQLAEDQNNHAGAEQAYRKALASDPNSLAAAEGLARVLIHEKKFEDVAPVLAQALRQAPNDPVLLAESATALAGEGKPEEAIPQLEALHRQNPNQPAVTRMLADLYSTGGHPAKAAPLYRQLLDTTPQDADLLTATAENMMRQQKWLQAVTTFQQSLRLKPDQGDAWSGLAFAASENGQYRLVLTALDRRAQYLDEVPATYFLRATALDHLHRTKEAVPYYRKFLDQAQGKFPDEESQTRRRLAEIERSH